jgi:hypothetical protein
MDIREAEITAIQHIKAARQKIAFEDQSDFAEMVEKTGQRLPV